MICGGGNLLRVRLVQTKIRMSAGALESGRRKITSAALGVEELTEIDADPGKLLWTSAVPPGTYDAVSIFGW